MEDTRVWEPTTVCGCKIEINARWDFPTVTENGVNVSYMNPKPYTINSMVIKNVCSLHTSALTDPMDDSVFFSGDDGNPILDDDNNRVQVRGYLKYPIANPTDAEKLYTFLYNYSGKTVTLDTCGCKVNFCHERFNPGNEWTVSRRDSKKCKHHKTDDVQHTNALSENTLKNDIVNAILEADPTIKEEDVKWSFDNKRKLIVDVPTADLQKKALYQSAIDQKLGANKLSLG